MALKKVPFLKVPVYLKTNENGNFIISINFLFTNQKKYLRMALKKCAIPKSTETLN